MLCYIMMGILQHILMFDFFVATIEDVNAKNVRCIGEKSSGEEFSYCCDNHIDVNGTCVECNIGYLSDNGTLCKPCPTGTYGRKCVFDCYCRSNQRCDHVVGCIYELSASLPGTTCNNRDEHPHSTTQKSWSDAFEESLLTTSNQTRNMPTQLTIHTPTTSYIGLHNREIIIYCVAAGSLIFIVVFCSVLLQRYRRNNQTTNETVVLQRRLFIQENMQLPHVPHETMVHNGQYQRHDPIYETIDESELTNMPPVSIDDISSASSSINIESPQLGVGYLNPYQPMVEDVQKHEYCAASGISDDSNFSHGNAESSAYLNPYQTVATDLNRHEYTALQKSSNDFILFDSKVEKKQTGSDQHEVYRTEFVLIDCSKRRCHSSDAYANKGIVTSPALKDSKLVVDKTRRHSS